MRLRVIQGFTGPEGRDGRANVGDFIEVQDDTRAKDLIRWGCCLPEDVIPKVLGGAGKDSASPSTPAARRSRQRRVSAGATASSLSMTPGAEPAPSSFTDAMENGGTDTPQS